MFTVRFIRKDNQPDELYHYAALEDAISHISLFTEDDSNYYRNISVLNEDTNFIMAYLGFDDSGKPSELIHEADIVRIKDEWCSKGEEKYLFIVTNLNENTDRCLIRCINSKLSIGSSENVDINMVKKV